MKRILQMLLLGALLFNSALAQKKPPTPDTAQQNAGIKKDIPTNPDVNKEKPSSQQISSQGTNKPEEEGKGCAIIPNELNWQEWLLIFSPLLVFLGLLGIFMQYKLRQFNMDAALSENEYPKIVIPNANFNNTNFSLLSGSANAPSISEALPPTVEISDHPLAFTIPNGAIAAPAAPTPPRPSISRYIALISTLLTLVIAVCLTCFYIYHYMRYACSPDLSGSTGILLALGLGVLPYAVNKVSGAVKKDQS